MAAKIKALLGWCKRQCEGYRDLDVTNFTSSWKSGLAFCAIIHRYRPDLIDYDSLSKENVYDNNRLAFDTAQKELGIAALLDPEDMVAMRVPDKLCIVTYVAQYYNYFSKKEPAGGPGVKSPVKASMKRQPPSQLPTNAPDTKRPATPISNANQGSKNVNSTIKPQVEGGSATDAERRGTYGDKCHSCREKVYLVERHIEGSKLYHRRCFREKQRSTGQRPSYRSSEMDLSSSSSKAGSDATDSVNVSSSFASRNKVGKENVVPINGQKETTSSTSLLKALSGAPKPYERIGAGSQSQTNVTAKPWSSQPGNSQGQYSSSITTKPSSFAKPETKDVKQTNNFASKWQRPETQNNNVASRTKTFESPSQASSVQSIKTTGLGAGHSNKPASTQHNGFVPSYIAKPNDLPAAKVARTIEPMEVDHGKSLNTNKASVPQSRPVVNPVGHNQATAPTQSNPKQLPQTQPPQPAAGSPLLRTAAPGEKKVLSGLLQSLAKVRTKSFDEADGSPAKAQNESPRSILRPKDDSLPAKTILKASHDLDTSDTSKHGVTIPKPILKSHMPEEASPPKSILKHNETSPTEPAKVIGTKQPVRSILKSRDSFEEMDTDDSSDMSSKPRPILKHAHEPVDTRTAGSTTPFGRSILKHYIESSDAVETSQKNSEPMDNTITSPVRSILKHSSESPEQQNSVPGSLGSPARSILKMDNDKASVGQSKPSISQTAVSTRTGLTDRKFSSKSAMDSKSITAGQDFSGGGTSLTSGDSPKQSIKTLGGLKDPGTDYSRKVGKPVQTSVAAPIKSWDTPRMTGVSSIDSQKKTLPSKADNKLTVTQDVRPKSPKAILKHGMTPPSTSAGTSASSPKVARSKWHGKDVQNSNETVISKTANNKNAVVNNFSAFNVVDSVALSKSHAGASSGEKNPPKTAWQMEVEARQGVKSHSLKPSVPSRPASVHNIPSSNQSDNNLTSHTKADIPKVSNHSSELPDEERKPDWMIEAQKRTVARAGKYEDPEFRRVPNTGIKEKDLSIVDNKGNPSLLRKGPEPVTSRPASVSMVSDAGSPKRSQLQDSWTHKPSPVANTVVIQKDRTSMIDSSSISLPTTPPSRPAPPSPESISDWATDHKPFNRPLKPMSPGAISPPFPGARGTPEYSSNNSYGESESSHKSAHLSRNPAFRYPDSPESPPNGQLNGGVKSSASPQYAYINGYTDDDSKGAGNPPNRRKILPEVNFVFKNGEFEGVLDKIDGIPGRQSFGSGNDDQAMLPIPPPRQSRAPSPPPPHRSWIQSRPLPTPPDHFCSVPKRRVNAEERMSTAEITHQLRLLDQELRDMEAEGRDMENTIRSVPDDAMDEDSHMTQWFELVNKKNDLVRRESDLMYRQRQQELEDLHEELEYELRCLMEKPDQQKTVSDRVREGSLLQELVDTVSQRNYIVDSIEEDRIRYIAEDQEIAEMMAKTTVKTSTPPVGKKKKKDKKGKGRKPSKDFTVKGEENTGDDEQKGAAKSNSLFY